MGQNVAISLTKAPADFVKVEPVDLAQLKKVKTTYYVDWSQRFYSPVRQQGQCLNAYAYCTADSTNYLNMRLGNGFPPLSVQHITECSTGNENHGCNGGWLYDSIRFQIFNGVYNLYDYPINPYSVNNAYLPACKSLPSSPKYYIRQAYAFITSNCGDRINTVLNGFAPAIGIAGGHPNFYYYYSGILNHCNYNVLNHAVVLVGVYFDTNNIGSSYMKVKNSWGPYWGESGYARIGFNGNSCLACIQGVYSST